MPFKACNHVKENGTFCGSAALRGRDYCYFHSRLRARRLAMQQAKSQDKPWRLNLPALEDLPAVQSALMEVLDALAAGGLPERRASLLLYGLQQAATNLRSPMGWSALSGFEITPELESRAESYRRLEAEFGLPRRLDLDTPPEVAFPAPPSTEADVPETPRRPPASVKMPESQSGASTLKLGS